MRQLREPASYLPRPLPAQRCALAPAGRRVRVGHRRLAVSRGGPRRRLRRQQLAGAPRHRGRRADPAVRAAVRAGGHRRRPLRPPDGAVGDRCRARRPDARAGRCRDGRRSDARHRGGVHRRGLLLDLLRPGHRRAGADHRRRARPRNRQQRVGHARQRRLHRGARAGGDPARQRRAGDRLPAQRRLVRRRGRRALAPADSTHGRRGGELRGHAARISLLARSHSAPGRPVHPRLDHQHRGWRPGRADGRHRHRRAGRR